MKIKNLTSPRGNEVPNQFEINYNGALIYQSYKAIIAKIERGVTYLDEHYWNYSKTTSKYRNIFLGENTKDTLKKIKSGEYILTDLSKSFQAPKEVSNFKFLNK